MRFSDLFFIYKTEEWYTIVECYLDETFVRRFLGFGPTCSRDFKKEYRKLIKQFALDNSLSYIEQLFEVKNDVEVGDYVNVILRREEFDFGKPFSIITTHYDHVELAGDGANEKSGVPIVLKLAEVIADSQYLFLVADREEANESRIFLKYKESTNASYDNLMAEYKSRYTVDGKLDSSHWFDEEEGWMKKARDIIGPCYGLGDKSFIDNFLKTSIFNIKLVINLDSVGGKDVRTKICSTNKDLAEKVKNHLRHNGLDTYNKFHNHIASQWQHYLNAELDDCVLIIDDINSSKCYHTREDTIDNISLHKLEKVFKGVYQFLKA